LITALASGSVSLAAWLGVAIRRPRAWQLLPIAEDEPLPPEPDAWPSVTVVVPARNEAATLPVTLPLLLA
jgi:hypothetical protein